jgi:hypothetical protein
VTLSSVGVYIVTIGGVLQTPSTYTVNSLDETITFDEVLANGLPWCVRSYGFARAVAVASEAVLTSPGGSRFNLTIDDDGHIEPVPL